MHSLYFIDNRGSENCSSGSDSLSTGSVGVITFAVTFIVSVTVTAIITFIVTYICVKRIFENTDKFSNQLLQEKVLYEEVSSPSHAIPKNDLELQLNPAYGTSDKVIMDTNPAYECHK